MKLEFFKNIFRKRLDIKFNPNPSSGSQVVPCRETDMTKQIVAFYNLADMPHNYKVNFIC
jgi:hypothetical protein